MLVLGIAFALFVIQIMTVLIVECRKPAKAVAWLTIMTVLPVVGFALYYFVAREYQQRRAVRRRSGRMRPESRAHIASLVRAAHARSELPASIAESYPRLADYLMQQQDMPVTFGNEVELYEDGEKTFAAMLRAMEDARDHIHVEFYIVRSDRIGKKFQDVWQRKARQGVKVRLIIDGAGSYNLDRNFISELTRSGAEVFSFLPPWPALIDRKVNYRNHRKIVVVDGHAAFIGGINIGSEYVGDDPRLGYWRDTHMQIRGPAAYCIQHIFMRDWALASGQAIAELPRYYPPSRVWTGAETAQVIAGGPDDRRDAIMEMLFTAITSAQRSVYMATPYFVPDPSISTALRTAAVSGIDVRILIPHVPDSQFVHWASKSYISEMMQYGVKCYMYTKGFLHAKVLIVDHVLASVGTANVDMRSFFSNFELNAVLLDGPAVKSLTEQFMEDLRHSCQFDLDEFRARPRLHKFREACARLLSPLL